jgi:hypothetical protein
MPPLGADKDKHSAQWDDGGLSSGLEFCYGCYIGLHQAQVVRAGSRKQCDHNVFGGSEHYFFLASAAQISAKTLTGFGARVVV